MEFAHGIDLAIPAIEITHHTDTLRIGRPDREVNAGRIADSAQVCAKLFVNLPVLSFAEQMLINLAHDRAVLIRIARQRLRAVPRCEAQMVIKVAPGSRHSRAEETVAMNFLRSDRPGCLLIQHNVDPSRISPESADLPLVPHPLR